MFEREVGITVDQLKSVKWSIIIPVLNEEKNISDTLHSIVKVKEFIYFLIIIPKGIINCKVYVFLSLFIKFSAMGLHQDIRNNIFS